MKLGLPLILGCAMIASMVLVQATAVAAVVRLVRRQIPPAAAFAHWVHNFTTLGYGDIVMSPAWRLLGPLEAVAGMLMFGVSTALLFAVTQRLIRLRLDHTGG